MASAAPPISNVADLYAAIAAAEAALPPRIAELDAALAVLDAPAWTAADLELNPALPGDAANHSTLDVCCVELKRRRFKGFTFTPGRGVHTFMGYRDDAKNVLLDSPFWRCVSEAFREAIYCLQVQQGIMSRAVGNGPLEQLAPRPVIALTPIANTRVPRYFASAKRQVLIAYQLATLLYATFDIRVPHQQDAPLWGDLPVYEISDTNNRWLASDCLDLTSLLPNGRTKDRYGLKPRLRADDFDIEDVGWDPTHPWHRTQWTPQTRVPWHDVLRMLVGYAKYAEALVPADQRPPASVLAETLAYCRAERARLQHQLELRRLELVEATAALARQHAREHLEQEARMRRLTLRVQALFGSPR